LFGAVQRTGIRKQRLCMMFNSKGQLASTEQTCERL